MASFEERFGPGLWATVVIATFNRADSLRRLLGQLGDQTIDPSKYEIVAIDDGSKEDTSKLLADVKTPCALRIERQENSGAAVARQRGVELAKGKIIVVIDDDMQVASTFVEKHLAEHTAPDMVVLGRLRPEGGLKDMPLYERYYARVMGRAGDAYASGQQPVRGHNVYTGNVSFPRELFLRIGGFDPQFRALEDEELGIRFEKAGAKFGFANQAESIHGSDRTSMKTWMNRAYRDGIYSTKVGKKHPEHLESSPWRHLPNINPVSRPILAFGLALPGAASLVGKAAIHTASAFDRMGLEPVALAGATLVYGIQFYRGVRQETGGAMDVAREYREFKKGLALLGRGGGRGGNASAWRTMVDAIREDNRMIRVYAEKYDYRLEEGALVPAATSKEIASDAVRKIGYQLMIAYRIMRYLRDSGLGLGAQFMSRLIRHGFSSDIHWDAELEPGVVVVHGFGLAISYAAKIGSGAILYQNVTLGYGLDPETKAPGAPVIEKNVHIGVGATLFGPIVIGEGTKIMANCVINRSVPPRSIVEAPIPNIGVRAAPRPGY